MSMLIGSAARAVGSKIAGKGAKEAAEKVVKKKMSKPKKAAIGAGVILGGKAIIGSDGKSVEPAATGISTSDAVSGALAQAGSMVGMSGSVTTLSGLQKGGVIAGGGAAFFEKGAGANYLANLQPNERAQVLLRLGQIPGLYAKGQAPTPDYIQKMISGGNIVPRAADFAALEQIAAVAEWSGTTIDNSIIKLVSQPALAQQFFGKVTTAPKAVTNPKELQAEINDKFQDIFDTKVEPELANAYVKEINKIESSRTLGSEEKEDILLKYIQKKAKSIYSNQIGTLEAGKKGLPLSLPTMEKGELGRRVRGIRVAYEDNGIPLDEAKIYNKAVNTLRSKDAYQNEIDNVMMQASVLMPAFTPFFKQGKTAKEILSPYITLKSQITGIPEQQIRVSDLYEVGAGNTAMSIPDYKKMIYKSEDYRKSDNFKARGLGDLQAMLRAFNIG